MYCVYRGATSYIDFVCMNVRETSEIRKRRVNEIPSAGMPPKNTQLLQTIRAYDIQR